MLGLGGTDPPGEGTDRSLRARMAVGTHDREAGQGQPEFRRDDVHDALVAIGDVEQADAGRLGGGARAGDELSAPGHQRVVRSARPGIDDVIDRAEDTRRRLHAAAALLQALERDRSRALMQENPVDRDPGRSAARGDDMRVPDLLEQRARLRLATSQPLELPSLTHCRDTPLPCWHDRVGACGWAMNPTAVGH